MTYESFVSQLKNISGDKNELKRLIEKKNILLYLESGVKAIDLTKQRVSFNPELVAEVRLDKIEEISEIEKEIDIIRNNIKLLNVVYNRQNENVKKILKEIYIKKNKKISVYKQYGFKSDVEMERYLKRSYV